MDQAWKHLKDTEFHIYDDIPNFLYNSRKGQNEEVAETREKGFTSYFSKAQAYCMSMESTLPLVNQ